MSKRVTYIVVAILSVAILLSLSLDSGTDIVKEQRVKVEESFNHDISAYTQGLFFYDNVLYETTGNYGSSSLRRVDLKSGNVLNKIVYDKKYFAEGSCAIDGRLYVLTWMEHKCFVYDINTLKQIGEFYNPREGWGLTTDGKDLIMSDGSTKLFFLDPMTFVERRSVEVTLDGKPLGSLNELEYINGEVWANVYGSDYIVIIDPKSGSVKTRVDCRNLLPASLRRANTDVLNGIAYNPVTGYIYLTGKNWPKLYRISIY